ncbi:hypothetical protein Syun_001976 [Stephania yunnanensis]|uniref:Uncharacterized protein n=1 Tax=Stephania yunnanensis TaxID=152371 RepID=A0AAP0LEX9_9MAGN
MTCLSQPSWVFPTRAINGVSASPKPKTNLSTPRPFKPLKISASISDSTSDSSQSTWEDEPAIVADPVKLAFSKANQYKKSKESQKKSKIENPVRESAQNGVGDDGNGSAEMGSEDKEAPLSVKLAIEKAREYKKNKGAVGMPDVEKGPGTEEAYTGNVISSKSKKEGLSVSSIDFMGLNFTDKKTTKGLPAGLVPVVDYFPGVESPEVEIIVGDASKFGTAEQSKLESVVQDETDLYKPKVSTWGVFPRPSNISKTFGGGRTIRPGEVIEKAEDKAAKEAHTRKLIAEYKKKMGMTVDARLKKECEKALRDGDRLMDSGRLREALPYYEKIMEELPFQSELHGLAALQWSICQDSLRRSSEAREMYEKLQAHSNVQVSKRARQFMFSFKAMEMMKLSSSTLSSSTGFQNYFEAFVKDRNVYPLRRGEEEQEEEGPLSQAFPYIILLVCPIFIVLYLAVQKGIS